MELYVLRKTCFVQQEKTDQTKGIACSAENILSNKKKQTKLKELHILRKTYFVEQEQTDQTTTRKNFRIRFCFITVNGLRKRNVDLVRVFPPLSRLDITVMVDWV